MAARTLLVCGLVCGLGCGVGCSRAVTSAPSGPEGQRAAQAGIAPEQGAGAGQVRHGEWLGFDRNLYPGDDAMASLRKTFAFTGYWISNPPGETTNTWVGRRDSLRGQGWGFLVLANGRLDKEILRAKALGTSPSELGHKDAATSISAARHEGFPAQTILFLDQEEGGRLLDEQAAYLLGWTEAVAASGFRPGVYASGQQVEDAPGEKIDTIQDIRARAKAGHLHDVAVFDALDQCPPAPGCTVHASPLQLTPDTDVIAWQYAQSPRRPEITKACGATYAADGNCYAPGVSGVFLDMNVAKDPDPSHGR